MKLDEFSFDLPDSLIARHPPAERDGGRLLVLRSDVTDAKVTDLPSFLRPGDLLVLNDVRVRRARLAARRQSGGEVEVLLVGANEALVRPSRKLKAGEHLRCGPGEVVMEELLGAGRWRVRCLPDVATLEAAAGSIPLPPYLGREAVSEDEHRYQTVFASSRSGFAASAAPTAGLHLTEALLNRLSAMGVRQAQVGLEVGLGTFQPLREEQIAEGRLHPERYDLPESTWKNIQRTREEGGRVVAVGTTVARVLESATEPGRGETRIFLRPGHVFRGFDLLFTNFHLPESSLLMLVCAFGGTERMLAAYRHAVEQQYRFFSYGDAMLIEPGRPASPSDRPQGPAVGHRIASATKINASHGALDSSTG